MASRVRWKSHARFWRLGVILYSPTVLIALLVLVNNETVLLGTIIATLTPSIHLGLIIGRWRSSGSTIFTTFWDFFSALKKANGSLFWVDLLKCFLANSVFWILLRYLLVDGKIGIYPSASTLTLRVKFLIFFCFSLPKSMVILFD